MNERCEATVVLNPIETMMGALGRALEDRPTEVRCERPSGHVGEHVAHVSPFPGFAAQPVRWSMPDHSHEHVPSARHDAAIAALNRLEGLLDEMLVTYPREPDPVPISRGVATLLGALRKLIEQHRSIAAAGLEPERVSEPPTSEATST